MWSEQGDLPHQVPSGSPGPWNSSAAAVLSYDIPHTAPWDFRVSLYTWTKSIAAGAFLAPLLLILVGVLVPTSPLWRVATPVVAGVFLALTGALLIWDLEHPERFYLIFTRPQWKSWLVRGGFIIGGFSTYLAVHFLVGLQGDEPSWWATGIGMPLAVMTAIYTAFLFGQSKARDLWQSPLLPPHLLVQALMAGAGVMALVALQGRVAPGAYAALVQVFAWASALHGLMVLGEVVMPSTTAHGALAEREMVHGRFSSYFWVGVVGAVLGCAAPWLGLPAILAGLVGLLAYEHAYVQAGQSVPLA